MNRNIVYEIEVHFLFHGSSSLLNVIRHDLYMGELLLVKHIWQTKPSTYEWKCVNQIHLFTLCHWSHNVLPHSYLCYSIRIVGMCDLHTCIQVAEFQRWHPWAVCVTGNDEWSGGRFKNTYELLNLRALKISKLHINHIFQCMGKILCVEFQRVPLKFHTKYLTHTLKNVDFIHIWKFKSSLI